MKLKFTFTLPAIIAAVLIFIASSFERVPFIDDSIIGWDKLVHMAVFFVFTLLLQVAFAANNQNWSNGKIAFISALTALIYALSDEIHQYFVPGRVCDIWDFAADSIGISLSLFFIKFTCNFVKTKIQKLEE